MKKENKKVEKKVEKKVTKRVSKPFNLKVRVNDIKFETNAKDLTTALTEFVESPDYPIGAKTIAFIEYSKGKNKRRKIWHTPLARRMFKSIALKPSYLEVLALKMEEDLK